MEGSSVLFFPKLYCLETEPFTAQLKRWWRRYIKSKSVRILEQQSITVVTQILFQMSVKRYANQRLFKQQRDHTYNLVSTFILIILKFIAQHTKQSTVSYDEKGIQELRSTQEESRVGGCHNKELETHLHAPLVQPPVQTIGRIKENSSVWFPTWRQTHRCK